MYVSLRGLLSTVHTPTVFQQGRCAAEPNRHELMAETSRAAIALMAEEPGRAPPAYEEEAGDVAREEEEEEENFEEGMRRNAADYEAHDVDQDNKLDFAEFCAMVRSREEGEHTDEELHQRFVELDEDGSGKVDMNEYIRWSLRDALSRSAARVIDLFRKWDEDDSGTISKREFRRAIRALGFDFFDTSEIDSVFDEFDTDGSGDIDYRELNKMLRQGSSVQLDASLQAGAAGEIKTASTNKHKLRKHRSKGRVLPTAVFLKKNSRMSVQQQLQGVLQQNAVRVIDIFREWDDDGDGLVSKKEFRNAIAALGYDAPREDVDAVFKAFDADGSGVIEYSELKAALGLEDEGSSAAAQSSSRQVRQATSGIKPAGRKVVATNRVANGGLLRQTPAMSGAGGQGNAYEVEADGVAREEEEEEENFEEGMRRNAADYEAHDVDQDNKLDFAEFCAMVRSREEGEHTDEELHQRFVELDEDGSGKVDMNEYIRWSLRDALSRSAARVIDLFRKWDEDDSGTISKREFRRAIRALGFDFFDTSEIDSVFDEFDTDGSGDIDYRELNKMLRQGSSVQLDASLQAGAAGEIKTASTNKHKLRKHRSKGRVLPTAVFLKKNSRMSVQQQLQGVLQQNAVRVIDIFREWDDDGDGLVSKKEFRNAIAALGYDAPREDVDAVFKAFDADGSGVIEYSELKAALGLEDEGSSAAAQSSSRQVRQATSGIKPAGRKVVATNRVANGGLLRQTPAMSGAGGQGNAYEVEADGVAREEPGGSGHGLLVDPEKGEAVEEEAAGAPTCQAAIGRRADRYGVNPDADVALLLEAAPLPLRVLGMPTGEMQQAHDEYDEPAEQSAFERQLRSQLDGLLVGGSEMQISEWDANVPPDEQELRVRRERVRQQAIEDERRITAAITVQTRVRTHLARNKYAELRPRREYRFCKTYSRVVGVGSRAKDGGGGDGGVPGGGSSAPSGPSAVYYVQSHEQLELVSVHGVGRLMLTAADPNGNVVIAGSCVFDSSCAASSRSRRLWVISSPTLLLTQRSVG